MRVTSPERLARLLSDRLAERGDRGRAITLAQLLEDVLAYPGVRSELGLAGKGEYDLAMLGLLAHRSLLQVDPAVAAAARRELESPEPGLGFSDDFSEHLLRLRPGTPPAAEPERPAEVEADEEVDAAAPAEGPEGDPAVTAAPDAEVPAVAEEPGGGDAEAIPERDAPDMSEPADEPATLAPPPAERSTGTALCRACAAPLPERDGVRYCPRCGADQTETRCLACGELLEREWRFCPRCGRGLDVP